MINALTIDVEDYFHVTAFEKVISDDDWDRYPHRVENNTLKILDLLDEYSVKATFFVLGWVARRNPSLVKEICRKGHEIACHGYGHKLVFQIGPQNFRNDIREAKKLIEDLCGVPVRGYRAPSYSITKQSLWAFDILVEEGFIYDSSIFPVHHDIYGIPDAARFPHDIKMPAGIIKEFPITTRQISLLHKKYNIPVAGGGYLRLFPSGLIKRALRHINECENQPVVLYFHPWEIDPEQPRIKAPLRSRFRHYLNLEKTEAKLRDVIQSLEFAPMQNVLGC